MFSRPDSKNWQYQETIKKGDLLLNRVQKLSRVINMWTLLAGVNGSNGQDLRVVYIFLAASVIWMMEDVYLGFLQFYIMSIIQDV